MSKLELRGKSRHANGYYWWVGCYNSNLGFMGQILWVFALSEMHMLIRWKVRICPLFSKPRAFKRVKSTRLKGGMGRGLDGILRIRVIIWSPTFTSLVVNTELAQF